MVEASTTARPCTTNVMRAKKDAGATPLVSKIAGPQCLHESLCCRQGADCGISHMIVCVGAGTLVAGSLAHRLLRAMSARPAVKRPVQLSQRLVAPSRVLACEATHRQKSKSAGRIHLSKPTSGAQIRCALSRGGKWYPSLASPYRATFAFTQHSRPRAGSWG